MFTIPNTPADKQHHSECIVQWWGEDALHQITNATDDSVNALMESYRPNTYEWHQVEVGTLLTRVDELPPETLLVIDPTLKPDFILTQGTLTPNKHLLPSQFKPSPDAQWDEVEVAAARQQLGLMGETLLNSIRNPIQRKLVALELLAIQRPAAVLPKLIAIHPTYLSCPFVIQWVIEQQYNRTGALSSLLTPLDSGEALSPQQHQWHLDDILKELEAWAEESQAELAKANKVFWDEASYADLPNPPFSLPKEYYSYLNADLTPKKAALGIVATLLNTDEANITHNIRPRAQKKREVVLENTEYPEILKAEALDSDQAKLNYITRSDDFVLQREGHPHLTDYLMLLKHNHPDLWAEWMILTYPHIPKTLS